MDKILFLGYSQIVEERGACVKKFLKEICGVQTVELCVVDEVNLEEIMEIISVKVKKERDAGNQVFFDLTGGESLPLVALGILSKEFRAPITLDLDSFVALYGGVINYRMKKDFKKTWSQKDMDDIENMWKISRKYSTKWVHYSGLLRKFAPDSRLNVCVDEKQLQQEMNKNKQIGRLEHLSSFWRIVKVAKKVTQAHLLRAEEMGIDIRLIK